MNCSITSPLEDANGEALAWHAEALPARELGDAAAVWDAMLDKLWGEHPLLKSMFINNLLRTFGTGREYLCVGTDTTGSPRAMAIVERVGLGRWQSFLPSEALIGPTLAYNVEQMDGLLASLPRPAVQVDLLSVDSQLADLTDNTPAPNSTWHALRAAIEVQGSFDSYWSERPSELRENVERNRCILGAEPASLKFVAIQSSEETTRALELHAALASDGPNPAAGAAAIADSRYAAFQRNLMNDAAHAGAARVFQLWRHDVLIASQLGLVNGRWLALLEPAYRQNVAESAPEQILLRHIVEHVFRQHRGGIIEFYGNPYNETKAWGTCTRAIRHINLYRFPHWREIVSAKRALTSRIAMPFVRPLKAKSHLSVQAYTSIDALPTDALTLFEEAEHRYGVQAGADWFRNLCGTVPPLGENAFFVVLRRSANAVAILPLLLSPTADGGSKCQRRCKTDPLASVEF